MTNSLFQNYIGFWGTVFITNDYIYEYSYFLARNLTFINNTAYFAGGAFDFRASILKRILVMDNCKFIKNRADVLSASVLFYTSEDVKIFNYTLSNNIFIDNYY